MMMMVATTPHGRKHRVQRRWRRRRRGVLDAAAVPAVVLPLLLVLLLLASLSSPAVIPVAAALNVLPLGDAATGGGHLALHLLGPRVWNHSLPLGALLDGVSHPGGAAARTHLAAIARELASPSPPSSSSPPIRVVALGGSITCGHMVERGVEDWFSLLTKEFLPRAFPAAARQGRLRAHNGCIPAVQSEMASLCLDRVLSGRGAAGAHEEGEGEGGGGGDGADLVLVEFSVNDGWAGAPSPDHARCRAYERLLRTVMRRGGRKTAGRGGGGRASSPPAVVLVHLLPTDAHKLGTPYYASAETDYDALARYYGLPSVSLKSALWHRLFAAEPGFSRADVFPETEERHPTPLGHRYVADLIVWLMQRAVLEEELGAGVFAPPRRQHAHAHLGPPMFPGNEESRTQACLMAEDLPAAVVFNRGWRWVNDAKNRTEGAAGGRENNNAMTAAPVATAKWGYSSNEVGATLVLRLDTRAHADADEEEEAAAAEERGPGRRRRRRLMLVPPGELAEAEARGLLAPPPEAALREWQRRSRQLQEQQERPMKKKKKGEEQKEKKHEAAASAASPSSAAFDADDATVPAEQTLPPPDTPKVMFVWIGYVASWRGVGSAVVWCARHCRCDGRVVSAWQASKTTQQVAARLPATQSPRCWVAVRVLNETLTGGHAFKVTGAMVGRRAEEGVFGDASELTVMEAFQPSGGGGGGGDGEQGD